MSSPSKPTRKTNRSVTKVSYADPEPDENTSSPNIEKKRARTAKASKKKVSSKAVAKGKKKKKGGNDSDSEEFEMLGSEEEEVTGSESEDEAPKKKKSKAAKTTAPKKTAPKKTRLGDWAGWICFKAVGGGRKLSEEEAAKEDAAIDAWLRGKRVDLDKLLVARNVSKFN